MDFSKIVSRDRIEKAAAALKANGNFDVVVAENGADSKNKVLALIPAGAEVMTMTSVTLDTIGLTREINESGNFESVKNKLSKMDPATEKPAMRGIGSAPEWAVGSAHAVTETGEVLIASNTGSQLPAYVYGAEKVVWVIGAQKIVADREEGLRRIYEYVLPLEGERANKAYNITTGSAVNKLLVVNKENIAGRITIVLVNEALGY